MSLASRLHLLKVTHHGSSGGTSSKLVNSLQPAIAIASTDEHHSHKLEDDVRKRLGKAKIFTTYDGGRPTGQHEKDIIVQTDGRVREHGGVRGILFEIETRKPKLRRVEED